MPEPKTFEDAIHRVCDEMAELIISKQKDYGKDNILNSPLGAEKGILVRMWDKFARLRNLITTNVDPQHEGLGDTWVDIVGYGLLALLLRRGWFELPFKEK